MIQRRGKGKRDRKDVERDEKGEKEKEKRKSFWGCVEGVVTLLKAHYHPCVVCMGPAQGRPAKGSPTTYTPPCRSLT